MVKLSKLSDFKDKVIVVVNVASQDVVLQNNTRIFKTYGLIIKTII